MRPVALRAGERNGQDGKETCGATILVNSNGGTINADGSCYGTVTKMRLTG